MTKISIHSVTPDILKSGHNKGNKFLKVETNEGKMSVFDNAIFSDIEKAVGKEVEVETFKTGIYTNIVAFVEVLGDAQQKEKSTFDEGFRTNVDAGNLLQRAIDLLNGTSDLDLTLKMKALEEGKLVSILVQAFKKTKELLKEE